MTGSTRKRRGREDINNSHSGLEASITAPAAGGKGG
jgi:hypothetical protein